MKKIFTLFALLAATLSSYAAAPELLFGDTPVVPGKTYETAYEMTTQQIGPMTLNRYVQDSNLSIKGEAGKSVTVELLPSAEVQFCSINGQCIMAGPNVTSTKVGILGGEGASGVITDPLLIDKATTDMTGNNPSELLSDITVEVKAYYTDTPSEYATAKVIMTNKAEVGGVHSVAAEKASITVKGNSIVYNFASRTNLCVYSIAGGRVYGNTLQGSGSVSLDFLHPGIYIYTTGSTSGKILIRK
ncbi:MAG: hypothetical protein K2N91_06630 [Muribaculaceae bacterium]|nr:hypothetical protein [Muribaculaceae bacterium]